MNDEVQEIITAFGNFVHRTNRIVYYEKADDLIMDEKTALQVLETIHRLDSSGASRVLIVQGQPTSYTFEAQKTLFSVKGFEKVGLVIANSIQREVGQLLKRVAKAYKATFELEVFEFVEEAEAWLDADFPQLN
ncbi:MAG: hypothetical protein IT327_28575 [Anaerolineae bacterium]|nr:hypothetical protein [Anaerolineae bacterium]